MARRHLAAASRARCGAALILLAVALERVSRELVRERAPRSVRAEETR
jgi:hypothetical protein